LARYGFAPDADTTAAAAAQHAMILDVSHERWQSETLQILRGAKVSQALGWLLEVGVLGDYMPEVAALAALPTAWASGGGRGHRLSEALAVVELLPADQPLWRLVGLLSCLRDDPAEAAEAADRVMARLRCSNHDRALVGAVVRSRDALAAATPPTRVETRRLLIALGAFADPLLAVAEARAAAAGGEQNILTQRNLTTLRQHHADLLRDLGGADLLAPRLPSGLGHLLASPPLSLPRGPALRQVMDWLLSQVLTERLPNPPSAAACLAAAQSWRDHGDRDLPLGWIPPPEAPP
jgi:hypothetical protein